MARAAQHKTAQRVAFRLLWVLLLLGATVFIIVRTFRCACAELMRAVFAVR